MDPIRAITLATWTPACYFNMRRRGAIAPGYQADFTLSSTLNPWVPERVYMKGEEVARDGKLLVKSDSWLHCSAPASPMNVEQFKVEDLAVANQPGRLNVIGVQEGSLLTRKLLMEPKVINGKVVSDIHRDVLKLVIYNRYGSNEDRSLPSVAFVKGIGLRKGAIASTVAHDSHNLMAIGTSDNAILKVLDAVRKAGGGMAIGDESGFLEILPLPVGGLMSDRPLDEVVKRLESLKAKARDWGSTLHNPFMALSFLALPVIPELKLTDLGLVDVADFSLVSLFQPTESS
jgi:adenine deaminase